jgi:oxygen-dependent protoporphyrinogen oxidase
MADVGVIGAGIAGLTAAYRLQESNVRVDVLEASDRAGGMIGTDREDGYLVELGPNSLRGASPAFDDLIASLDLEPEVVEANRAASTRYVVRDGAPRPLPMSPWTFLTTDLLSTSAKFRLLGEPFVSSEAEADVDESVASFVRRRLGPEVLDYMVDPFVGGIFAGDPDRLSLRNAFERLHEMEAEHGSLFGGLVHAARNRSSDGSSSRGLFSFDAGLRTLPDALADALGDSLHLRTRVEQMRPDASGCSVTVRSGDGAPQTRSYDAVISTLPLHELTAIDFPTDVDLEPLENVPYPPVSVLALGFREDDVQHPLDGFGMLVPSKEDDFDILGTIFSSTLFPGRAPDGHVLLTTFIGGMRRPELGRAETDVLKDRVLTDLDALLGLDGAPTFVRHVPWNRAIPQYLQGYDRVTETLDRLEDAHPGLAFAGNYRQGISVGDALDSGADAAERIRERLDRAVTAR